MTIQSVIAMVILAQIGTTPIQMDAVTTIQKNFHHMICAALAEEENQANPSFNLQTQIALML